MRQLRAIGGLFLICSLTAILAGCSKPNLPRDVRRTDPISGMRAPKPNPVKVAHVIVALCDNQHQGIVKVPARIGNGDDLVDNLYWGASLGVKSFFLHGKDWKLLSSTKPKRDDVLERVIFEHKRSGAIMVADAYRGAEIKRATSDYFDFLSGNQAEATTIAGKKLTIGGGADMVAYVGHDGLMEWDVPRPVPAGNQHRPIAVALACKTQQFFTSHLQETGTKNYVLTKSLMAPEAYSLAAILDSWIKGQDAGHASLAASTAYAKYQKISLKAAQTVFVASP